VGGQGALARRIEQAFGFQPRLEFLVGAAQGAFAGFLHVVQHQLVVTARFVQGQAAAGEHAHAFARGELQPGALGPEHRAPDLGPGVLEAEVQVPGRRPRHAAQFAFHPHQRERALQQVAGEGVQLAGAQDFAGVRAVHALRIGHNMRMSSIPADSFGPAARRRTRQVRVGNVLVGGDAPVVVQSMTNTDTADVAATVRQVAELWRAGSELVRVTVNTPEAAAAVPRIVERLQLMGVEVPVIGDFHYNGHQLLANEPACARALAKYRINPGNVGFGRKRDTQFAQLVEFAIRYDKPVRIGANWGSLDQSLATRLMDENALRADPWDAGRVLREALILSALESAQRAVELGLPPERIILSAKVSGVQELIAVYRDLAARSDFALHLGLTEAGIGSKGIVASSAALAVLLQEGIGDTIRISLTPEPGGARTQEVVVAQELLQTMGLRAFTPMVTACPGCGRTTSEFFQELARVVQEHVRAK